MAAKKPAGPGCSAQRRWTRAPADHDCNALFSILALIRNREWRWRNNKQGEGVGGLERNAREEQYHFPAMFECSGCDLNLVWPSPRLSQAGGAEREPDRAKPEYLFKVRAQRVPYEFPRSAPNRIHNDGALRSGRQLLLRVINGSNSGSMSPAPSSGSCSNPNRPTRPQGIAQNRDER